MADGRSRSRPTACATCASTRSTSSSRRRGRSSPRLDERGSAVRPGSKTILPMLFGKDAPYGHPVIGRRPTSAGRRPRSSRATTTAGITRTTPPRRLRRVRPGRRAAKIRELFGPIPSHRCRSAEVPGRARATIGRADGDSVEVRSAAHAHGLQRRADERPGQRHARRDSVDPGRREDGTGSTGSWSRTRQSLAMSGRATTPGAYPGWFAVQVELLTGQSREKAEGLVVAELKRLADEPVPPDELEASPARAGGGSDLQPRRRSRTGRQHRPCRHADDLDDLKA